MNSKAYQGYINLKYRPKPTDVIAYFYVEPRKGLSVKQASQRVAAESSIGTWTGIQTMKPSIRNKLQARVCYIKGNYIKVAYPLIAFEKNNVPQILSSVAGNVFGMNDIENLKLIDIDFPSQLIKSFKGPKYGIKGIRKMLNVYDRPLLGSIIKPKMGLNSSEHAKVAYDAWLGGCDIIKDDENLTNQSFNPFKQRVRATLKACKKAEHKTREIKAYMPNITAKTDEMIKRAKYVESKGGKYIMIDIITCGFSALQTIRELDLNVAIHAHRAMHAAITRNKKHGISMLTIGKFSRLIGVDQIHIGTIFGKMEGSKKEVLDIERGIEETFIRPDMKGHFLGENWKGVKPVFAVCSGGLHPALIPKLVRELGKDIIIQMGGGIHGHAWGTKMGAKAARQAISASMKGIRLDTYAETHPVLKQALIQWKT